MKFGGHKLRAELRASTFRLADSAQLFREYLWESELWLRAVSTEFVTSSAAKPVQAFLVSGRIACQK